MTAEQACHTPFLLLCSQRSLIKRVANCGLQRGFQADSTLFRLDYISCLLTVVSTILVGHRNWYGWAVAGVNSVLICVIALRTDQTGFIPGNIFCLAIYAYNITQWRTNPKRSTGLR